jgi:predicted Zn-dependent protease
MGNEAAMARDDVNAMRYWRLAFHSDPRVQSQIIESLASQMPAELFLKAFEPDTMAMGRLFWHCRTTDRMDEAKMVGEKYAVALEKDAGTSNPAQAANCWHYAQEVNLWLGKIEKAVQCQRRAVDLAPQNFDMRRTLASLLANTQQYAESAELLEWCLRRHPEDEALQQELNDVRARQAESVRTASSPPIENRGL